MPYWLKESNINEDEVTLMHSYIIGGSMFLLFEWVETGLQGVEEIFDTMIKYGLYNYVYTK
ncbi:MAG: hypothetical protein LUH02_09710 [Erysipelotrichaceae bacterium]|nr:hypothetical protein [Erysipelotrichaceae bacterium]